MPSIHPTRIPLCLLIAAAFPVQAQQATPSSSTPLGEVLITAPAERPLPTNSAVVTSQELAAKRAASSDTASLLRDVPGVSLYGAGGVSSLPAIHGMADDRVRTKLDGMDLIASCPNHMNPALSYVDPSNVGTLKVYAGIVPVSVGGDSIGGTIVAETPLPMFAAPGQGSLFKGEAGAFYRSNGNGQGANLSATYATDSFNVSYTGASAQSDNYHAGRDFKTTTATGRPGHSLPLDEVGSTAYDTRNHTLGLAWRGGNHLFEAKLGYQDLPYQLYPNQRMDMLGNTQHSLNLRYLGRLGWGTLEARAYGEKVDHYMDFGADKQFVYGSAPYVVASGMPMYTKGKTTGASVKAEIDWSAQDLLRLGGEYQHYRLDDWWPPSPADLTGMLFSAANPVPATYAGMAPNTFWNINGGQRDRLGLFAEWEKRWSPQWLSLLGVRAERVETDTGPVQGYNSVAGNMMYSAGYLISATSFNALDRQRTDNNLDFTALARYAPDASRTLEFGFAQKTRSPNLYERYSWSRNAMALIMNNFVGDGNGYLGNPDLKPEVAHTLSLTGDWHSADRAAEVRVTPYYTQVDDFIDAVPWNRTTNVAAANAVRQFGILKFMNQSARLYGLDLSGRMPLGKSGWGEWGFKGLLNYTKGKNRDTGDDLYNIMPLNAKLSFTHQLGGWDDAVELVAVKAKRDVSDARQEIQTPGYGLVNLRASYAWQRVRVDLGIDNLFDKYYALPLGGAYTGQGATMSLIGIPWGIAVPGAGRSLYTGVNVKF